MHSWPLLLSLTAALPLAAAPPVDFARDVRPILSDRCFACHGPDVATRQAGLRLDIEEGAKKPRGARTPIVPGNASASEVLKRVAPENPARRMPPPYSDRRPLSATEVATLRAWMRTGCRNGKGHWSFTRSRSNRRIRRFTTRGLDPQPDRQLHPRSAGTRGSGPFSRGGSGCACFAG